jgi:nicotinamide-nucleotide amidase
MSDVRDFCLPDELVEAARRAIEANRVAGRKIAVAESCTAGLVCAALTEVAGSSDVFEAGFVTYSNEAKIALLGISEDVLDTFGAVSIAVAWGMAQGALSRTKADVAVAITGIAGPGGGSERKPVGTVVFARALRGESSKEIVADQRDFGDLGRGGVRLQAALCALELLMPPANSSLSQSDGEGDQA